ncbi:MAG: hypothetical protein IKP22_00685 [Clostridia bacterium]|nr:hypothetical protein [Clostridia bacterium]
MKKNFPRSIRSVLLILFLSLALSGCSSAPKDGGAPTASPASTPETRAAYSGMKAAWLLDSPVYTALNGRCTASYMWTVPRDVLSQAALDLTGVSGREENGMTRYDVLITSVRAYTASGMDQAVLDAAAEADESGEEDESGDGAMVTDLMGDFSREGGGEYVRSAVWMLSPDYSLGTAQISLNLNGEESGSERFAFTVRGDILYFYDVTENATLFNDEGGDVSEPNWLVTRGCVGRDMARIVEYTDISDALPDPESLPSMMAEDESAGMTVLVYENGKGAVTRGGRTLQEFSAP